MSKSPEQRPELYCGDSQLRYVSFLENDESGAARKLNQVFYYPSDEIGRKTIEYILAKDKDYLTSSEFTLFANSIRGCSIAREISEPSPHGLIIVTYDLPQWPTSIEIRAKVNGFVHLHMQFPMSENLARMGYKPDGTLAGVMLLQDQGAIDWKTGRDTIAFIKRDAIHFYDDEAAYDRNELGQSEELELGKEYDYLGDKYKIDLDTTGRTMITETVRENGRKRVVAFPLNIGDTGGQLRDPRSFYWAQIPWLEDVRVEISEPS